MSDRKSFEEIQADNFKRSNEDIHDPTSHDKWKEEMNDLHGEESDILESEEFEKFKLSELRDKDFYRLCLGLAYGGFPYRDLIIHLTHRDPYTKEIAAKFKFLYEYFDKSNPPIPLMTLEQVYETDRHIWGTK